MLCVFPPFIKCSRSIAPRSAQANQDPDPFSLVLRVRSVIQIAMNHRFRLGLPGSGQGYNIVATAGAGAVGKVPARAALVLSDVQNAGILGQAGEMSF